MQILPYWIQLLQALATPVIAALAIVIGVMQWRTAHQRAVLDLFDKRWTVLTDLRAAVGQIVREAKVTPESTRLYATARDQAAFLFGPKVTDYLESINKAMGRLYVAEQRLSADEAVIDQKYSAMVEISEFFERTNELMMPYMRMHQRAPSFRTPASWWRWLRTTGCLAVAGLLLVLTTGGAGAQQQRDTDSANFMLPHCKRFLVVEPGKATFTEGLCAGSITSLAFVGEILSSTRRFCFPQNVTNEQMIRVVVAYIEARPARIHEDYRNLALEALREAWPCS